MYTNGGAQMRLISDYVSRAFATTCHHKPRCAISSDRSDSQLSLQQELLAQVYNTSYQCAFSLVCFKVHPSPHATQVWMISLSTIYTDVSEPEHQKSTISLPLNVGTVF